MPTRPRSAPAPRRLAATALLILGVAALLVPTLPARATEPADLPVPAAGVRVVDPDRVLSDLDVAQLQGDASTIERSTGAQVVFVTTVTEGPRPQPADAARAASALLDRWGVGRAGVDDGVLVLVMLDATRCHGAARIQVGRGVLDGWFGGRQSALQDLYAATMEPQLKACRIGRAELDAGAALVHALANAGSSSGGTATTAIPTTFSPDERLAVTLMALGLLGLALIAGWWWFRLRDPAPQDLAPLRVALPADVTPALGATLLGHGSTDTAFTTAVLDRASHGQVRFQATADAAARTSSVRILGARHVGPGLDADPDDDRVPRASDRRRAADGGDVPPWTPDRGGPSGTSAEDAFAADLDCVLRECRYRMAPDELWRLGPARRRLGQGLEAELVQRGLLRHPRIRHQLLVVPAAVLALAGVTTSVPAIVGQAAFAAAMLVAIPLACVALIVRPPLTPAGVRLAGELGATATRIRAAFARTGDLDSAADDLRRDGLPDLWPVDRLVVWSVALGLADELRTLLWQRPRQPALASTGPSWWNVLGTLIVFDMLVTNLGSLVSSGPSSGGGGGFWEVLGGFGGGSSFGGGGGGGGF
ncbi:MAG: TPM domain-containing protein [Chloroflexota bacterium]